MSIKHVYEAPEAEALLFHLEGNFCVSDPPVKVTFGGSGENDYFDEEKEW